MPENRHPDACRIGVAFIEAQLTTLHAYASLLSDWIERGAPPPDFAKAQPLLARKHSHPEAHTHSEDGTPMKSSPPENAPSWPSFDTAEKRIAFALTVPCTNAILAVAESRQVLAFRSLQLWFFNREQKPRPGFKRDFVSGEKTWFIQRKILAPDPQRVQFYSGRRHRDGC